MEKTQEDDNKVGAHHRLLELLKRKGKNDDELGSSSSCGSK
jgi:hypothetical protein